MGLPQIFPWTTSDHPNVTWNSKNVIWKISSLFQIPKSAFLKFHMLTSAKFGQQTDLRCSPGLMKASCRSRMWNPRARWRTACPGTSCRKWWRKVWKALRPFASANGWWPSSHISMRWRIGNHELHHGFDRKFDGTMVHHAFSLHHGSLF